MFNVRAIAQTIHRPSVQVKINLNVGKFKMMAATYHAVNCFLDNSPFNNYSFNFDYFKRFQSVSPNLMTLMKTQGLSSRDFVKINKHSVPYHVYNCKVIQRMHKKLSNY